jgi:hypothetical protein
VQGPLLDSIICPLRPCFGIQTKAAGVATCWTRCHFMTNGHGVHLLRSPNDANNKSGLENTLIGEAPRFPCHLFVTPARSDQSLLRTSPQPMTITNRR